MSYTVPSDPQWQPGTFLERGVAVPFTTPVLAGARARPAARFIELIVPHPAGIRGVYIMAWSELGNFCAATLHDLLLAERIAGLAAVGPRDIRRAARAVAAEGAAGRPARAAAQAMDAADHAARLMTNIVLLRMLVAQTGGGVGAPAALEHAAKTAIRAIAPKLGSNPTQITNQLEALAGIYATVGLPGMAEGARCAILLEKLSRLHREVALLTAAEGGQAMLAAKLVASGAALTLAAAGKTMASAAELAQDLPALLARFTTDPAGTANLLTRPEWLLDGWDEIAALWQLAADHNRRATLCEMATMLPVIPIEAEAWLNNVPDNAETHNAETQRLRKLVQRFEDWRSGTLVIDLVARNEQIRALAA